MSDLSKLNGLNIPQLDLTSSINMCQATFRELEDSQRNTMRAIEATQRERERNEKEKRENLKRIADNSEDTVNALKETNELLRQNNELLKRENENLSHQLSDIQLILLNLFSVEVDNGKDQAELMKQAIDLASKIDMSITATGKFDWKGVAADTTITGAFMALQVYLRSKGINI